MLTEESITEALLLCQRKRERVAQFSQLLTGLDSILKQEEKDLISLQQLGRDREVR